MYVRFKVEIKVQGCCLGFGHLIFEDLRLDFWGRVVFR